MNIFNTILEYKRSHEKYQKFEAEMGDFQNQQEESALKEKNL